jgi:hypothetical protein
MRVQNSEAELSRDRDPPMTRGLKSSSLVGVTVIAGGMSQVQDFQGGHE